jgi:hypothetical protein
MRRPVPRGFQVYEARGWQRGDWLHDVGVHGTRQDHEPSICTSELSTHVTKPCTRPMCTTHRFGLAMHNDALCRRSTGVLWADACRYMRIYEEGVIHPAGARPGSGRQAGIWTCSLLVALECLLHTFKQPFMDAPLLLSQVVELIQAMLSTRFLSTAYHGCVLQRCELRGEGTRCHCRRPGTTACPHKLRKLQRPNCTRLQAKNKRFVTSFIVCEDGNSQTIRAATLEIKR